MLWREKRTKLFSWKFYGCKYPAFSRGKYFFCHQVPIPRITKTCSPDVSELCKDMARTPCPIPWKRGQGRVHCECWLPHLLLPWLGETVMSNDFPARSEKWSHTHAQKSLSRVRLFVTPWTVACPHGLYPARLLCPWDFPGKNTGVGCHFLLQGIFLTQGSNLGLLPCRQIVYHLSHQGSPTREGAIVFFFFPFLLAALHSMWDLSSPTRNQTCHHGNGSSES